MYITGADPGFKEGGVSEVAHKAARGVWGHAPPEKFVILMPSRLILLHSQPILKPKPASQCVIFALVR